VHPHPNPTPSPRVLRIRARNANLHTRQQTLLTLTDEKALSIGKKIIADHSRDMQRLKKSLRLSERKYEKQKAEWEGQKSKLEDENRVAQKVVLCAVVVTTEMCVWRAPGLFGGKGGEGVKMGMKDVGTQASPSGALERIPVVEAEERPIGDAVMVDKARQTQTLQATVVPAEEVGVAKTPTPPSPSPSSWCSWFWK
jgi:hypothetical protein